MSNGYDKFNHIPVLHREVINYLNVCDGKPQRFIDGTLGLGGHSSLILKNNEQAELLGIDRDGDAISCAQEKLAFAETRFHLERGDFSDLAEFADRLGWHTVDGILLDLGVSSPQLDCAERGFSHRMNGPLDMRMDNRSPVTACRFLNQTSEQELARVFRDYGEIRSSRKLAKAIVERRKEKPWMNTEELKALCEEILQKPRPGKLPIATLCFQAIRIAVNDELGQLQNGLKSAVERLKTGGRLVVISFHSLEDRIVKHFFREMAETCICPPHLPLCACNHHAQLKVITKKPVTAAEDELADNKRAACAKLRVAEKL